jgi:hypothetical protein
MRMQITLVNAKRHIVAELLIIKYARGRGVPLPDAAQTFWIYYRQELQAYDYQVEPIINADSEMAAFYEEWEHYDTFLPPEEDRRPIITLAMKLVIAKALKYADDATLHSMITAINEKLKASQQF